MPRLWLLTLHFPDSDTVRVMDTSFIKLVATRMKILQLFPGSVAHLRTIDYRRTY